jgi:hypothetical protein
MSPWRALAGCTRGLELNHDSAWHEREILLAGGLLSYLRNQRGATSKA